MKSNIYYWPGNLTGEKRRSTFETRDGQIELLLLLLLLLDGNGIRKKKKRENG
jgi:hypothetical protein